MGEAIAVVKINNFRDMYIAELQELVRVAKPEVNSDASAG
jgi:hypothetical protein